MFRKLVFPPNPFSAREELHDIGNITGSDRTLLYDQDIVSKRCRVPVRVVAPYLFIKEFYKSHEFDVLLPETQLGRGYRFSSLTYTHKWEKENCVL